MKIRFSEDRTTRIGENFLRLAEKAAEDETLYELFQAAVEEAHDTVEGVFTGMIASLEGDEADSEVAEYQAKVLDSLAEVAELFQLGLFEISEWEPGRTVRPVRVGISILEKAEERFLQLQRSIERVAHDPEIEVPEENLWGRLLEMARETETEAELQEFHRFASRAESLLMEYVEETLVSEIATASEILRDYDGKDLTPVNRANQRLNLVLLELKERLGVWP